MKRFIVFLAIACYCIPAFAQTLAEGYIVKNSGDTLRGFIRERVDWFQPYIDFAKTESSELVGVPLYDIKAFYLKKYDAYYYGRILEIDKKPVDVANLERLPARKMVKDTIALRLLVKGAVNFYDYTDENFKQHFFVQKNNGDVEELAYVRYMAQRGSVAEMPYFVEPLRKMLEGCDKVNQNLIRYDEKALTKVVQQYNSCFGTSEQFGKEKEHAKLRISAFAGGGISKMGFKDEKHIIGADPAGAKWPTTSSVLGGVRLDLIPGRDAVRFIPAFELMFQKTGESKASRHLNTADENLAMGFTFINLGLSIKYLIVKTENVNVYLKGTVNGANVAGATSTYTKDDLLLHQTTGPATFATYNKFGFAYGGGLGASFNKLSLDLNYNKTILPVYKTSANGLCTNFYLTAGVRISKN